MRDEPLLHAIETAPRSAPSAASALSQWWARAGDASACYGEDVGSTDAEAGADAHVGGKAGVLGTSANVVVQIMGLGITTLSFMLRQGGWACLALMVACALAANYTGKILIACCYDAHGARIRDTYGDIGEAAFGPTGRFLTRLFENVTFFGVCALFLILAGEFLSALPVGVDKRVWTLAAAALVAVPVLVLPDIAEMRWVSFVGVGAVIVVAIAVLGLAGFGDPGTPTPHTDAVLPFGFLTAFSSMTLAFGCHAGLPAVEKSMRAPPRFNAMFNIAFAAVLALYLPVAIVGYAKYGASVHSPILLSLPSGSWLQVLAKAMLCAHVMLAYPILMMLFVRGVENALHVAPSGADPLSPASAPGVPAPSSAPTRRGYIVKRTVIRAVAIALNVAVAIFAPYFSDMMGLIGALGSVMTTFVLPTVFYVVLRTTGPDGGHAKRVLPVAVGLIGAVGGFAGAVEACISLVRKISARGSPWS